MLTRTCRTYLETGNTEVLAVMISRLIGCDVHRIEAAEPYSDDYQDTVERNVREQSTDARPAIANPLASIDQYGTVLLASGIWNVRAPMIMSTFADGYDFTGKTIHPVTTYAMSGPGTTERDYAAACRGAVIAAGLAVRGEEVNDARPAVETNLAAAKRPAEPVTTHHSRVRSGLPAPGQAAISRQSRVRLGSTRHS